MVEQWIEGYDQVYTINSLGQVYSYRVGRFLKPFNSGHGYMKINLRQNGKIKSHYVHRLVANAFLPKIVNKTDVNHKDGNKSNNILSNLEWSTRSENIQHAWDKKLRKKQFRSTKKSREIMYDLYNFGFTYETISVLFKISVTATRNGILEHKKELWRSE